MASLEPPTRMDARLLLVVAAPVEWRAVCAGLGVEAEARAWAPAPLVGRVDGLLTGVGKANAAGAVASTLARGEHARVLNAGIAGTLGTPEIGQVVVASGCAFADEGVATPGGFQDLADLGFSIPPSGGNVVPVDEAWSAQLARHADARGIIATVSTCSGTDELAREVVRRTGAIAEGMEGAACALAALRLGVPFAELRAISNSTGERGRQRWDIQSATARLSAVLARACQAWTTP